MTDIRCLCNVPVLHCCRYVSQVHVECKHPSRIGNVSDGGWDICLSPPFQLVQPCLVYSFGYVVFVNIWLEVAVCILQLHHMCITHTATLCQSICYTLWMIQRICWEQVAAVDECSFWFPPWWDECRVHHRHMADLHQHHPPPMQRSCRVAPRWTRLNCVETHLTEPSWWTDRFCCRCHPRCATLCNICSEYFKE